MSAYHAYLLFLLILFLVLLWHLLWP